MTVEDIKPIQSGVSKECLKKLRILAIKKDTTLNKLIRDILEKYVLTNKLILEEADKTL